MQPPRRDHKHLAANLHRLMWRNDVNNSRLSKWVGVSRETVGLWLADRAAPADERLDIIAAALRCTLTELLAPPPPDDGLMPIREWAAREAIPLTRARDLFGYGLLLGAIYTPLGAMLVPRGLHAPEDSKRLVRIAKVRPPWVAAFRVNFPALVRERQQKHPALLDEIADTAEVSSWAVKRWLNALGYPKESRLPQIALALDCTVDDLIRVSPEYRVAA